MNRQKAGVPSLVVNLEERREDIRGKLRKAGDHPFERGRQAGCAAWPLAPPPRNRSAGRFNLTLRDVIDSRDWGIFGKALRLGAVSG